MAEGSRFTLPSLGLFSRADLNYLVAATADSFTDIKTSGVFLAEDPETLQQDSRLCGQMRNAEAPSLLNCADKDCLTSFV